MLFKKQNGGRLWHSFYIMAYPPPTINSTIRKVKYKKAKETISGYVNPKQPKQTTR